MREGLLVAQERTPAMERMDFDHDMDPDVGQQILRAIPPVVLANCTDTNGTRAF